MLINTLGAEKRYYDCIEENGWEVDLEMMEGLCDENTRAIMVVRSSRPSIGITSDPMRLDQSQQSLRQQFLGTTPTIDPRHRVPAQGSRRGR
jgi:tyrosine aminotransferase